MNIAEVIALVNTNRGNGKKENLNRMHLLMDKLGNPQKRLKFIHIAGTNGKGTTAAFIASILEETSLKTGLFTSPHLEVINERIKIDQQNISDESFIQFTERVVLSVEEVESELSEKLYSFEILTAIALLYFAEQECDMVILETGIGGRLDSTNVIQSPEVAVITSIGLDHMAMLGNTVEDIAKEKAGIIKNGSTVITCFLEGSLREIFVCKATQERASLLMINPKDIEVVSASIKGQIFRYKDFKKLMIRMIGEHQLSNAAIAIEVAIALQNKGYDLTNQSIKSGLEKAFWAGRMETLLEDPIVITDGAHNEQGVALLSKNLRTLFPDKKFTFVVGMMRDKAYMDMIKRVGDLANLFITVSPDPWRGFDAETVASDLRERGYLARSAKQTFEIIDYIQNKASKDEMIIVFGSLYLVGELRKLLLH